MRTQIKSLSLIVSGLLLSSIANAGIQSVKDWTLSDDGSHCSAYTQRLFEGKVYRFELSLEKSNSNPIEIYIREPLGVISTKAYRLVTEVKPSQSFAFASIQDSSGQTIFWQVPTDTTSLISYIKRQTRVVVRSFTLNGAAAPTVKTIDFSLMGSSAIVDAMTTQCRNGGALANSDFEKYFIPEIANQLDPIKLKDDDGGQLRSLFQAGLAAYNQKNNLMKSLNSLNSQYASLVAELARVDGSIDELSKTQLTQLRSKKLELEQQVISLDQQLVGFQSKIANKEAEVVAANGIYDQAWKVLAPVEPEHKRLKEILSNSQNDLRLAQGRLDEIDNSIQSKSTAVVNYESEVSSLQNQLITTNSQVRQAQSDAYNASRVLGSFNAYRERDERIMDHPIAAFCHHNRENFCMRLMNSITSEADQEVSQVQNKLSQAYNSAQNEVQRKMDLVNQIDSKIRNYTQYEIPSLRNQIADLRSQRPSAEAVMIRYRDVMTNNASALQTYDNSVGYAEKRADFDAKAIIVVRLQSDLSNLEKSKQSVAKLKADSIQSVARVDQSIQDILVDIQSKQGRSSELNQILQPYFDEKIRLTGAIDQAEQVVQVNRQQFNQVIVTGI